MKNESELQQPLLLTLSPDVVMKFISWEVWEDGRVRASFLLPDEPTYEKMADLLKLGPPE